MANELEVNEVEELENLVDPEEMLEESQDELVQDISEEQADEAVNEILAELDKESTSDEIEEESLDEGDYSKKKMKEAEDEDEDDDEEPKKSFMMKKKVKKEDIDVSEHIDAMLTGHELSEDFQEKARTIFEAAVLEQVNAEVEKIDQAYNEDFEKSVLEVRLQIAEKVDEYLSYVAKEWLEENKIVVESSLKLEIMENFISGMKNVFEENYIEVPEEKKDLYVEAVADAEQAKEQLNEEIEKNVKLSKEIENVRADRIIRDVVEGMTIQQADKIRSLAEGIEFTSTEDFAEKVKVIKENYFPSEETVSSEVADGQEEITAVEDSAFVLEERTIKESSNPVMENYARAISRFSRKQ
jgi:hypothetical protein